MKSTKDNLSQSHIGQLIRIKDSNFWNLEKKNKSLYLFHRAAKSVPAYKDFLKKNNINHQDIRTWEDFQKIPPIDKNNYLRKYQLEKLCWGGKLDNKSIVFTATSGSTGEPFYFPREQELDYQYSFIAESFLKNNSSKNGPTLVIIGFGMGVWIGGIITYKAFEIASQRTDHKISIITTGINKKEIFSALRDLAPHFKNTVLIGYPPFVKDIIDEALQLKINLKKINLRLVFAAEVFDEDFRDYLVKKAGVRNRFLDTMNIYGSADIGAMASETPLSILIRTIALKKDGIFRDLFQDVSKVPTVAQFNPLFINFESVDKDILLTGNNTVPLVRYSIGDNGGVFNIDNVANIFKKHGVSLKEELRKAKISEESISNFPFVYVYERKDLSTKLYGAIIYPEHIRHAILRHPIINSLTGKFTLTTKYDSKNNQYMEINCELRKGQGPSHRLKEMIKKGVVKELLDKNAEYTNNYKSMPKKVIPHIVLWPNEDLLHFKLGTKQKWVTI